MQPEVDAWKAENAAREAAEKAAAGDARRAKKRERVEEDAMAAKYYSEQCDEHDAKREIPKPCQSLSKVLSYKIMRTKEQYDAFKAAEKADATRAESYANPTEVRGGEPSVSRRAAYRSIHAGRRPDSGL